MNKDFVEGFKFFTKPLMLSFPILAVFKIGVTQIDAVEIDYENLMNYTTKCFGLSRSIGTRALALKEFSLW